MNSIEKSVLLMQELNALRPIDKVQEDRIMQKFRLDWNYHSNHLEGNSLTYGETKALLLFGITANGKPIKDHLEVEGHNEAINYIIEIVKDEYPLTESFIRELHKLLLKKKYQVDAITTEGIATKRWIEIGQYKTTPNHVVTKTGELFYFATPEETPSKMHDLMDWYKAKKEDNETNGILLAAEFHYKFIRIHPFDDGNGRMARILMNFILMQYGYPLAIIKTTDRENYFIALQLADAGTIEPFIEYIAVNLNHSINIMIAAAKGESIDEPDDIDKEIALLEQRVNAIGRKISVLKSSDSLLNFYDFPFKKLYVNFIAICNKYVKFYVNNSFRMMMNGSSNTINEHTFYQDNRKYIDKSVFKIEIERYFDTINNTEIIHSYYSSKILIVFQNSNYEIFVNDYKKMIYKKYYDEQLTDEEINHILILIAKEHTEFIDQKLIEAKAKE